MKLNYRRTVCVGFAFFLICEFWQAYDNTIPMILTNKFGMSQTFSGFIMALDNILALFMLPLFGTLSDRTHTRLGRRTPYILFGTIAAVCAFVALSAADAAQLKKLGDIAKIDDPAALVRIYEEEGDEELLTPGGESFRLCDRYDAETFSSIKSMTEEEGKAITNPEYANYVVPARQAAAARITRAQPGTLIIFIVLLFITLVSMATFRSPAVALMPDVTIKPLRSKGNAVINLMGSAGGILALVLGMIFATSTVRNSMMSYTGYFALVGGIMLAALALFMLTVREPRFVQEMQEESRRFGLDSSETEDGDTGKTSAALGSGEKRSLLFIFASIVFWFAGYNAVTSKYSVYAGSVLHTDYNLTLIIAQLAAIVSYLPVGIIASKAGRKKTILAGVAMLSAAFAAACFMNSDSPSILMNCAFALAGIAWATINVNSFPMVVEMCREGDVGKYTGFYYAASMAAQVATPIASGFLMDRIGMRALFPYAVFFVVLSFITMLFVKHGDSKPVAKRGLEALEDMDAD